MKAIIQMVHKSIMGSVVDAIEYYLVARLYSSDIYLLFINIYGTPTKYDKDICQLIHNKYKYPKNKYYHLNIKIVTKTKLLQTPLDLAIVIDWGTIPHIRGMINAKQLYIVSELTNKPFFLDKEKYHATYFGEMPFVYKDVNYRMKMAFDLYPKLESVEEALYINSPNNDFESDTNLQNKAHGIANNKPLLFKAKKHKQNLFSCFDEYLYYHANKYFDPHPRLFHECYFYNKKIHYVNNHSIRDGSYYRYNDLMKTGLENRVLDKNDEIIKELIK